MNELTDLSALRLLLALDAHGTLTAAAEVLSLSQPAATHQLHRLERDLGVRVVEKRGRGLALTPAGRAVLARAGRIVGELTALTADLRALAGLESGEVRIGGGTSSTIHLLPGPLAAFRALYPGVSLFLREATTGEVMAAIAAGDLDVGVVALPASHPGLSITPWLDDTVLLLGAPGAPLTTGPFDPQALDGAPLITMRRGSRLRAATDAAFAAAGIAPHILMELESIEAMKAFAAAGLGYAPVGLRAATRELAEGRLVALAPRGLSIVRNFGLAVRTGAPEPATQAFLRLLQEVGHRG